MAPRKSAATVSAADFSPGPYSTTVVAWFWEAALPVLVTVNFDALRVAAALVVSPPAVVPL